jgi:hypothetical protein
MTFAGSSSRSRGWPLEVVPASQKTRPAAEAEVGLSHELASQELAAVVKSAACDAVIFLINRGTAS